MNKEKAYNHKQAQYLASNQHMQVLIEVDGAS